MRGIVVCTIICIGSSVYGSLTRNMGFKEVIGSTQMRLLREIISFQEGDHRLEKQCELELSLLYPPVSCLKRIDRLRAHYRRVHLFSAERTEYDTLCVSRARQIKDANWIQKAIAQKPGNLCQRALIRQKNILVYRDLGS